MLALHSLCDGELRWICFAAYMSKAQQTKENQNKYIIKERPRKRPRKDKQTKHTDKRRNKQRKKENNHQETANSPTHIEDGRPTNHA